MYIYNGCVLYSCRIMSWYFLSIWAVFKTLCHVCYFLILVGWERGSQFLDEIPVNNEYLNRAIQSRNIKNQQSYPLIIMVKWTININIGILWYPLLGVQSPLINPRGRRDIFTRAEGQKWPTCHHDKSPAHHKLDEKQPKTRLTR